MRHFRTLLLKEEQAIFASPIAYATLVVYLLLMGYTFTAVLFLNRTGDLVRVFFQAAVLFLLIVPVVTISRIENDRPENRPRQSTIRRLAYDRTTRERREAPSVAADERTTDATATATDPVLDGFERETAAAAFASLPERWRLVL